MRLLKTFLYTKVISGDWTVEFCRDYDEVFAILKRITSVIPNDTTVIIHIGFNRLSGLPKELPIETKGQILLTAPARFVFNDNWIYNLCDNLLIDKLPVFIVLPDNQENTIQALKNEKQFEIISIQQMGNLQRNPSDTIDVDFSFNWLKKLAEKDLELVSKVSAYQIYDEKSYQAIEKYLEDDLRKELGIERFHILSAGKPKNNISFILKCSPPWLLQKNIQDLGLPVRSYNSYRRIGIKTVADLLNLGEDRIDSIKNYGIKSKYDTLKVLLAFFNVELGSDFSTQIFVEKKPTNVTSNNNEVNNIDDLRDTNSDSDQLTLLNLSVANTVGENQFNQATTFVDELKNLLAGLNENQRIVIEHRMGFKADFLVLQDIADRLEITRERVRQIENKSIVRLIDNPLWKYRLRSYLGNILDDRSSSLPLVGLEVIDDWFRDVSLYPNTLSYCFEQFLNKEFSTLNFNGQWIVSRLSQTEWGDCLERANILMQNGIEQHWTYAQTKLMVSTLLPKQGQELQDELWEVVLKGAHFKNPLNDDSHLIGYGYNLETYVKVLLEDSDRPLHYSELCTAITSRFNRSVTTGQAQNAASNIGYLLGRGTYGLYKHIPINQETALEIVEQVEDLIIASDLNHQWTCVEILNTLFEQDLYTDFELTHFILNALLQLFSKKLAYLGRFVWAVKKDIELTTSHRIDMRQAVIALLQQQGHPLPTYEIKERLLKERGLSTNFQIHPNDKLIRLGNGLWGLFERDLTITQDEQDLLVYELEEILRERNVGLHSFELEHVITVSKDILIKLGDPIIALVIAKRSGRMRVAPGQILCLPDWDDPRTYTVASAVRSVLERSKGSFWKPSEIVEQASHLYGYPIKKDRIYGLLYSIGAVFDEVMNGWHIPSDKENQLDE